MLTDQTLEQITAVQTPPRVFAPTGTGGRFRRQGFLGFIFSRQPLDALVLGLPVHDGSSLAVARQIHHRLLARLTAVRVFYRQWYCILSGALLCLPMLTNPDHHVLLYPDLAGLVGAALFLLLLVLLPGVLMRGVCSATLRAEVAGVSRRCFLREVPADAPSDLQDPWRHGWLTADARPLSAEISEADLRFRLTRVRAWWWIPSVLCLCVGTSTLLFGGMAGLAFIGCCAIIKLFLDRDPGATRPQELEAAEAVEAAAFVEAGGEVWARTSEEARRRQFVEAVREKSEPIVELGISTGILAARGDFFAPSRDLPVSLSRLDLRTHLLVLGGTGSGKTSGILRPIAQQVAEWPGTGLLVLDGKGGLPMELAGLNGLTLVDPRSVKVSLVKGLSPDALVAALVDIVEPVGSAKQDPFWRNGGQALLRHSAVLAKTASGRFWNLQVVAGLGVNSVLRQQVLQTITDEQVGTDPTLAAAVEYFQYDWKEMDERTRGGIATTAQTWISTVTAHPDLLAWAQATPEEDEVPLESVLHGGRFGLLLPAYRYAHAGAIVTAILKARVYAALKARAEGWQEGDTPVVFIVDEAQEVAIKEDATMLSIGRSLGLSVVSATQTIEAVVEKLGPETAAKWLGIYGSVIALQGRSPETDRFVAEKLGVTWKPRVEDVQGMAVRTAILAQSVSGAIAATRHQASLVRYVMPEILQRRAVMGVLGGLKQVLLGESPTARPHSRLGTSAVVEGEELATLLGEPDTALAVLNRARVPRRDVIRLKPVYAPVRAADARDQV